MDKRCKRILVVLLVISVGMPVIAQTIEVPLTFQKPPQEEAGMLIGHYRAQPVPVTGVKAPSDRATVSSFTLQGRDYYFASERAKETDEFYSRLYFDANGNKDLTDDTSQEGVKEQANENVTFWRFDPFAIEYQLEGQTLPYNVKIMFIQFKQGLRVPTQGPSYQILSIGVWTGSFNHRGKAYTISFGDSDFDGDYGTRLKHVPLENAPDYLLFPLDFEGDRFCVGAGSLSSAAYGAMALSEHVLIGDDLYRLEVRTAQRKAILTPVEMPRAPVKVPKGLRQVQLVSEDMSKGLCLIEPPEVVHVPNGNYYVVSYQDATIDEQGDTWVLMATGNRKTPMVIADGGKRAEMAVGAPYLAKVSSGDTRMERGGVSGYPLTLSVQGKGKEPVVSLMRTEGTKTNYKLSTKRPNTPLEPAFKVVQGDGEVVASGTFEYG